MVNNEEELENLEKLKNEVKELNLKLKQLGKEKEDRYSEKKNLEHTLNQLINEAKELKDKKNAIDTQIHDLKQNRDSENKIFKEILAQIHKLQEEKRAATEQLDFSRVRAIKKELRQLEFSLQTEVISFEKEKKHMEKIKKLRAHLTEYDKVMSEFKELENSKKLAKEKKNVADELHRTIQKLAKESSSIFNDLTEKSMEISKIKEKRGSLVKSLRALKSQINILNKSLSGILKSWSDLTNKVFKGKEKRELADLQEKTDEIKKKLKEKKKLTTEDILVLQRESMGR